MKKKVSEFTLIALGLIIVFYNHIVAFLQNTTGLMTEQARLFVLIVVVFLVYYKTPWIKTILRG
jgi:vacuolar-type H+-ATPase subunit I/STV1